MEKQLKLELLEKLMDEMDEGISKRLPMKERMKGAMESEESEPVAVVEEKSVMPLDEAKDLVSEKLSEETEEQEDDEDYGDSSLMQRLKELRKKKSLQE